MSEKITKDGQEIEVFTPEEVEAQKTEALEAYKAEHPDNADAITKLQDDLKKAQEDLTGYQNKDLNFKNLRDAKEAADKKVKDIEEKLEKEVGGLKNLILSDKVDTAIKSAAQGDADLEKKIKFHYERIKDPADNAEQITKKVVDAAILATGGKPVNVMIGKTTSSAGAPLNSGFDNKKPLSPEQVELGKRLGLNDEDLKKYGGTK